MLTNAEVAAREHTLDLYVTLADRYRGAGAISDAYEILRRGLLASDSGDAPCSRWGRRAEHWTCAASALALVYAGATGEPLTAEDVDYAAGLVVNDHDDCESLIRDHGGEILRVLDLTISDLLR